MVAHVCNPGTWEVVVGGDQPQLHSEGLKHIEKKEARGVTQLVQCSLSVNKALSSILGITSITHCGTGL